MTRKIALLIGVSDYASGLSPLPGAVRDVEAVRRILLDAEMGNFDEAVALVNPDRQTMEQSIEKLFAELERDDLALLFFSGHGVKDNSGNLYLATRITEKNARGQLTKSTAVPASFVHDIMDSSRSKRQVIILDCCFSGAFAEGMKAKDDGFIDVRRQFGGEGRAVLTSSTSTQYSFEQDGSDLSIYTHHLIEGIETGAADLDKDDWISVNELHEYAGSKVRETVPTMKPEIYAVKEGYNIHLAKAPANSPKLKYRRELEQWISDGEIAGIGRTVLENLRNSLNLTLEDAAAIEARSLYPHRDYQRKLRQYEVELLGELRTSGYPFREDTQKALKQLQKSLQLKDEDVAIVETLVVGQGNTQRDSYFSISRKGLAILSIVIAITALGFLYYFMSRQKSIGIESYTPLKISPNRLTGRECNWLLTQYDQSNQEVKKQVGLTESPIRTKCKELGVSITVN
ncbi:MAG: caspase family protein [Tildeniella nuda ZEHNDER 1965/U140]|jgi:branched-chain amino acid transport system substrate-binding protein|nr:caspase family protein [Tildeniella nuda ZEHNDER 1965/U140]